MPKCEICGFDSDTITWTHLRTHGLTVDEYRKKFPEALLKAIKIFVLPREVSELELSYFAGILDGEGSFGSYELGPRVTVGMNDEKVIDWILERFGGNKQLQGKCFRWTVYVSGCRAIIPLVLPFLITKKQDAEIVLRIANSARFGSGVWLGERTELKESTNGNRRDT